MEQEQWGEKRKSECSGRGHRSGPGSVEMCMIWLSLNFRIPPWNNLGVLIMNRESSDRQEDYRRGAIIEVIQLGNSWD